MSVRWDYLDADGTTTGRSDAFADRAAAEEWMGQAWQDLLDSGVADVELRDQERDEVLYRMSLRES